MLWKHRKSQSLYDWLWKCLKVTRCNCVNHIYYSFARELSIESSGEFKTAGVSSIKLLLQQLASTWFVDSDHLESPIQMNNFKELGKPLFKRNIYFSGERNIWILNRLYIQYIYICIYVTGIIMSNALLTFPLLVFHKSTEKSKSPTSIALPCNPRRVSLQPYTPPKRQGCTPRHPNEKVF